jgi:hypothetical protein
VAHTSLNTDADQKIIAPQALSIESGGTLCCYQLEAVTRRVSFLFLQLA